MYFDFGRIPQWNCPIAGKPVPQTRAKHRNKKRPTPAPAPASDKPWFIPPIQCYEPEDGVFFAQVKWIYLYLYINLSQIGIRIVPAI